MLVSKWRRELQFCRQNSGESIDDYTKRIYRLFKQIRADGPQTESAKIYEFTKGLQTEIAQVIHNHIGFNANETLSQDEIVAKGDAPEVVAETVLRAANAASPKRRYTAGKAAGQVRFVRRFLPEYFVDKNIRKFSRLSD
jgi:hypothetical protein